MDFLEPAPIGTTANADLNSTRPCSCANDLQLFTRSVDGLRRAVDDFVSTVQPDIATVQLVDALLIALGPLHGSPDTRKERCEKYLGERIREWVQNFQPPEAVIRLWVPSCCPSCLCVRSKSASGGAARLSRLGSFSVGRNSALA